MKNLIKLIIFFAIVNLVFIACKKNDYILGGKLENNVTPLSTYDYLKSNQFHMFDTLLMLVDKTGLKDAINQKGITFYAPSDYSIDNYLQKKTLLAQNKNPNAKYTIDSLIKYDLSVFKDSLNAYIVPSTITYQSLTQNGVVFQTAKSGSQAVISFEQTTDTNYGYSSSISTIPRLEYYTFIKGTLPPVVVAANIAAPTGIRALCQTSGLTTSTGQLNVLSNTHILYFHY